MGKDDQHIYTLSNVDENEIHGVIKGEDGKIHVQTSTYSMALHEITHVGQALTTGIFRFVGEKLANPAKSIAGAVGNEIVAYRTQFSLDPSNMPIPTISINFIDNRYIKHITNPHTGLPLYDFIP